MPVLHIPAQNKKISVPQGTNLLDGLKAAEVYPDAPCGGNGTCGKCRVLANGTEVLACRTAVTEDLCIALTYGQKLQILQTGICADQTVDPLQAGHLLSFDIGTTSVVCFLSDGRTGAELAKSSMQNPQTTFGADVISRIQAAIGGEMTGLTNCIREGMTALTKTVCAEAGISPDEIGVVSIVGNPAMQQLFLGILPKNLSEIPFAPVLKEAKAADCRDIFPICPHAKLLIVPDISGYVGADTIGCILSTELYKKEALTLLLDIGTNGELVLGNKNRMIACATAAGPALEGANIQFGMRGTEGAIDHVWLEKGNIRYSVIGGGAAKGICGSGLIDAIAVGLDLGLINKRGRLQNGASILPLNKDIHLTQEDIRQVQLAKGAIYAGICLMVKQLDAKPGDIQQVLLAGAFGNYINIESACRIGLLPEELLGRIAGVGNAAGSGAKMLSCNKALLPLTQKLTQEIEFLELASLPDFPKTFAKAMLFQEAAL